MQYSEALHVTFPHVIRAGMGPAPPLDEDGADADTADDEGASTAAGAGGAAAAGRGEDTAGGTEAGVVATSVVLPDTRAS
jgi:hypothetical protein